jgi:hypothetical protein
MVKLIDRLEGELLTRIPKELLCSALEMTFETTAEGGVMKNEQNSKQILTHDAKVPYEPPALTLMGKVERLTAIVFRGPRDLLAHGNIL